MKPKDINREVQIQKVLDFFKEHSIDLFLVQDEAKYGCPDVYIWEKKPNKFGFMASAFDFFMKKLQDPKTSDRDYISALQFLRKVAADLKKKYEKL